MSCRHRRSHHHITFRGVVQLFPTIPDAPLLIRVVRSALRVELGVVHCPSKPRDPCTRSLVLKRSAHFRNHHTSCNRNTASPDRTRRPSGRPRRSACTLMGRRVGRTVLAPVIILHRLVLPGAVRAPHVDHWLHVLVIDDPRQLEDLSRLVAGGVESSIFHTFLKSSMS